MSHNSFICLTKSPKATRFKVGWSDYRQSYFLAKIQLFCHKSTRNFLLECIGLFMNCIIFWIIVNFCSCVKDYSGNPFFIFVPRLRSG